MKRVVLLSFVLVAAAFGCRTRDGSMELRASMDQQVPQTEPFSEMQFETVQEPAGAESQTEAGIKNPFLYPRTGSFQKILPQNSAPPQQP